MAKVRLLHGKPLMVGGKVALSDDCCCGPIPPVGCCPKISQFFLSNDLSHMVQLGIDPCDKKGAFYPPYIDESLPNQPGDAFTLIALPDNPDYPFFTVYGPDFSSHPTTAAGNLLGWSYVTFTPVSGPITTGSGTEVDPFVRTTVVSGGAATITQVDTWWVGADHYRTDVAIAGATGVLFRAMDIFLADSDLSHGFANGSTAGAVGAIIRPGDFGYTNPFARTTELVPITGGNGYMGDQYYNLWDYIGGGDGSTVGSNLPNTCITTLTDSAAGLSWSFGGVGTFSHYTKFGCSDFPA